MRDTPLSRPLFAISSTNRRSTDVYSLKEADDVKLIAVCTICIPIIEFSPRNVVPTDRCRHVPGVLFIEFWGDSESSNAQQRCKQPIEGIRSD